MCATCIVLNCLLLHAGEIVVLTNELSFVGTQEYHAKCGQFLIDYNRARLLLWLGKGSGDSHFAIAGDYYVFTERLGKESIFEGYGVHGRTGEVRAVSFSSPSGTQGKGNPFSNDSTRLLVLPKCSYRGELFQEPTFSDYRVLEQPESWLAHLGPTSKVSAASMADLNAMVANGPSSTRQLACNELIARGETSLPIVNKMLQSESRVMQLCSLYCLKLMNADIGSAEPALLRASRHMAKETYPICPSRVGSVLEKCSDGLRSQWKLAVANGNLPVNEQVYLIEALGWSQHRDVMPFLVDVATRHDTDPNSARAAIKAIYLLNGFDELIVVKRNANEQAKLWARYYLDRE